MVYFTSRYNRHIENLRQETNTFTIYFWYLFIFFMLPFFFLPHNECNFEVWTDEWNEAGALKHVAERFIILYILSFESVYYYYYYKTNLFLIYRKQLPGNDYNFREFKNTKSRKGMTFIFLFWDIFSNPFIIFTRSEFSMLCNNCIGFGNMRPFVVGDCRLHIFK